MSLKEQSTRSLLPARYARFTLLNELIRSIQELYDQTPSEAALRMLTQAKKLKEIWWEEEDEFRAREFQDLLKNFNQYSHSVRVAALDEDLQ